MFYYLKKTSCMLLCATLIGFTGMPLPAAGDNPLVCSAQTLLKKNKKLIAMLAALATVCVLLSSSKVRSQAKNALAWTALAVAVRFGSTSPVVCKQSAETKLIATNKSTADERFNEITDTPGIALSDSLDYYLYQQDLKRNQEAVTPPITSPMPPPQQTAQNISPITLFALKAIGTVVDQGFILYNKWNTPTQSEETTSGPGNEDEPQRMQR